MPLHSRSTETLTRRAAIAVARRLGGRAANKHPLSTRGHPRCTAAALVPERLKATSAAAEHQQIITTTLNYDDWYGFLGQKAMVGARLDLLRHHRDKIHIAGTSLRASSNQHHPLGLSSAAVLAFKTCTAGSVSRPVGKSASA